MSDLSDVGRRARRRPARPDAGREGSILTETLPWLETYAGKIVVIKYGGNAMIDENSSGPSPRTSCS